ncbi:MAG: hypothetical protein RJA72_665 [Pseudomonadota bacterium]|jgi:hypothetical protein
MYDPASDIVYLKKLCTELQRELAYSQPDRGDVEKLARDVEYLAGRIIEWAKE